MVENSDDEEFINFLRANPKFIDGGIIDEDDFYVQPDGSTN